MKSVLCILTFGMIAACGSAPPPTETADAPDPADDAAAATADVKWDDKNREQRLSHMKDAVAPQMGEIFLPHKPDFNCTTCHGTDYEAVDFKMPNTLKPLNPQKLPFDSEDEKIKATAQMMMETVVPKMAGLLDKEPYDPETQVGFGCFGCHASATE